MIIGYFTGCDPLSKETTYHPEGIDETSNDTAPTLVAG
jgi:hypothetical protein